MSQILYARILVTYRGRFYAVFNGDVLVIDPFSLDATPLIPSQPLISQNHLVPSGNDEIFLVERIRSECWSPVRVSKLDEEAGKWVAVTDLGDRVLFIGKFGNLSCSAKELPHGCGLSGNSILFTNVPGNVTNPYKYGVHLRRAKCWRLSRKNRMIILNTSPVMVLQHFRSCYWKKNDSRRGLAISTKKTPSNSFSKLDRRSSASKMAERREEADVVLWRGKQDAFRSTKAT